MNGDLSLLLGRIEKCSNISTGHFNILYSSKTTQQKDVLTIRKDMDGSDNVLLIGRTTTGTIVGGYFWFSNKAGRKPAK